LRNEDKATLEDKVGRSFEKGELSEEKKGGGGDPNEEQTIYEGTFEHYEQEE